MNKSITLARKRKERRTNSSTWEISIKESMDRSLEIKLKQ